jgi:5-methylcytosine-specific restriction enzyme A
MASHRRYATPQWRAVRLVVLRRDRYICQLRLSRRCHGVANSVDHKIRPEDGGSEYDPTNLQAACMSCNITKRNRDQAERARRYDQLREPERHSEQWYG